MAIKLSAILNVSITNMLVLCWQEFSQPYSFPYTTTKQMRCVPAPAGVRALQSSNWEFPGKVGSSEVQGAYSLGQLNRNKAPRL